jgi:hypothetical protein
VAGNYSVELSDSELKMLLVAVRQVKNTIQIAEEQSRQAGEPLSPEYDSVKESYDALEKKLAAMLGPGPKNRRG